MSLKYPLSVVDILAELVAVDTRNPPGNEFDLISIARRILEPFPIDVSVYDLGNNRGNMTAVVKATNPTRDPIILNGHLDTVPVSGIWKTDPHTLSEQNDQLIGLGAADMKGALASQLTVLINYSRRPDDLFQDLWIVWTAGEEVNCLGAIEIAPFLNTKRWTGIIIGEPSMNKVTTAQKGAVWIEMTVHGHPAHGAYPERGINAIRYCTTIVNRIMDSLDGQYEHPLLGPATVNWASIRSGTQPNIVPDIAETVLDIRFPPPLTQADILEVVESAIDHARYHGDEKGTLPGLGVTTINYRAAFETDPDLPLVADGLALTGQDAPVGMRAYTDGSVFAHEIPCPVIILGPGDITQAHAPNEQIAREQLVSAVRLYSRIVGE